MTIAKLSITELAHQTGSKSPPDRSTQTTSQHNAAADLPQPRQSVTIAPQCSPHFQSRQISANTAWHRPQMYSQVVPNPLQPPNAMEASQKVQPPLLAIQPRSERPAQISVVFLAMAAWRPTGPRDSPLADQRVEFSCFPWRHDATATTFPIRIATMVAALRASNTILSILYEQVSVIV